MTRPSSPDTLFDAQGPRERLRMNVLTAVVLVIVAGAIVFGLVELGKHGHLQPAPWLSVLLPPVSTYLLGGLWLSLISGLLAGILAFPLAVVLAVLRLSKNRVVSTIARWWIEVTRSIPVLLVIYFVQLFLPSIGIRTPVFWQLIIPLALYHISILAELFRAGVEAVPAGQREAAESLGLRPMRIYQQVVLPQAVRVVLPSLITQFVRLFKDTALGYLVTYPELMTRAKIMSNYTGNLFETYAVVGMVYLVINLILAQAARALDRRMRSTRRRVPVRRRQGDEEAVLSGLPASDM